MTWTVIVWRILCLLTITSGLAAATGLYPALPPLVQALGIAPGLVVTALLAIAGYAESSSQSRKQSPHEH